MISQNVAPGPTDCHCDCNATDITNADVTGDSGCEGLEVRHFTRIIWIVVITAHQLNGMFEAPNVHKAHAEREEYGTNNEP